MNIKPIETLAREQNISGHLLLNPIERRHDKVDERRNLHSYGSMINATIAKSDALLINSNAPCVSMSSDNSSDCPYVFADDSFEM